MKNIRIELIDADALRLPADVLLLKYAQQHFGVDKIVAERLAAQGADHAKTQPAAGHFGYVHGGGSVGAKSVLFVGVVPLYEFSYEEIREFARRALSSLAKLQPTAQHVAATLHGVGYGLDEAESLKAEVAGFFDAIRDGEIPVALERVSIVERSSGRVARLSSVLDRLLPEGSSTSAQEDLSGLRAETLRSAGYTSISKPRAFVAMPFRSEMDDTYHYGIQKAVHEAGFLCERADLSSFVGDVMQWVHQRIRSASLVIADLTDANPNVYLEVGYAWASGVPTVLVARNAEDLLFDVRGQRCLVYGSIRDVEELLKKELTELRDRGAL